MKAADPSYSGRDINTCVSILNEYLEELGKTNSKVEGMVVVKSAVLKLNKLNKECGAQLIETAEREKIAEIINLAGYEKGYHTAGEDVTEKWRAW